MFLSQIGASASKSKQPRAAREVAPASSQVRIAAGMKDGRAPLASGPKVGEARGRGGGASIPTRRTQPESRTLPKPASPVRLQVLAERNTSPGLLGPG